jgi:hypothetical protein
MTAFTVVDVGWSFTTSNPAASQSRWNMIDAADTADDDDEEEEDGVIPSIAFWTAQRAIIDGGTNTDSS